jgi:5-methylthioadenosine/S-adenosylhomocysteine deaminase
LRARSAKEIFTSATLGGARGIGRKDLGRIAPGALADIAVVDMEALNNVSCRDPVKNLVNSASCGDVRWVIVDGRIVVEDERLTTIDEERLIKQVQKTNKAIWDMIPENHYLGQSSDEVSPQSFKLLDEG